MEPFRSETEREGVCFVTSVDSIRFDSIRFVSIEFQLNLVKREKGYHTEREHRGKRKEREQKNTLRGGNLEAVGLQLSKNCDTPTNPSTPTLCTNKHTTHTQYPMGESRSNSSKLERTQMLFKRIKRNFLKATLRPDRDGR